MNVLCCNDFNLFISSFGTLLTGIGACGVAYWAINKYYRDREHETKLSIELTKYNYEIDNSKFYLDILLKNGGNVPIRTYNRFQKGAEVDASNGMNWDEEIKYSIELQIKKVKQTQVALFDWKDSSQYVTIQEHINLLTDIESPEPPSFYLEPKDTYHLGCWLQLDKGLYEAKVIFIGEKRRDEFWHRRFPFEVK
jgi:hypothetical protein